MTTLDLALCAKRRPQQYGRGGPDAPGDATALRDDCCVAACRRQDNAALAAYQLDVPRARRGQTAALLPQTTAEVAGKAFCAPGYPAGGGGGGRCQESGRRGRGSLGPKDGVGLPPSAVPCDSSLVRQALLQPRQRQQLPTRVFTAVPDLSRGRGCVAVESRLLLGCDPVQRLPCDRLAEGTWDTWDPVPRPVEALITPWTWGGAPTRGMGGAWDPSQGPIGLVPGDAGGSAAARLPAAAAQEEEAGAPCPPAARSQMSAWGHPRASR
jgi:hypothetical protein